MAGKKTSKKPKAMSKKDLKKTKGGASPQLGIGASLASKGQISIDSIDDKHPTPSPGQITITSPRVP